MKKNQLRPSEMCTRRIIAFLLLPLVLSGISAAAMVDELLALRNRACHAESSDARIALLEEIAAMQVEGEPALESITKALAVGLKDDVAAVRLRTAELLGPKQHPDTVVRVLARATKVELGYWNRAGGKLNAYHTSDKAAKLIRKYWKDAENGVPGAVRSRDEYNEVIAKRMKVIVEHASVQEEYITQLATWSDDRSVAALAVMLAEYSDGKLAQSEVVRICLARSLSAIDALLSLRSQPALEAVTDSLASWTKRTARAHATLKKMDNAKSGTYGQWEINAALSNWQELEKHLASVRERVVEFASANKLATPPGSAAKKSAWHSWRTKTRQELPKSLGSVAVTGKE